MTIRKTLPNRRESITTKLRVGGRRTIYLSTNATRPTLELFVRVRGDDCSAEIVALYDIVARLTSVALQYGCPVQTVGKLLLGVQFQPAGIVTGHDRIHFCSSLPDAIGQHLLSLSTDAPTPPLE